MASQAQPALDGGWGWVIVLCSIINHAGTIGLMLSLSVLYVSWLDHFGASKGMTSWILSVGVACMFGLCPISANLATKFGFRTVAFVGGLLTCVGLAASAFARSITHLIVSIGFVTGTGCCFSYLPGVAMVALYFDKRRSLAMGIATAGSGIGAFGFAPLLDFLEKTYGWRGALLVMGAITLHMCATGMLFRPLAGGNQGEGMMEMDEDTELSSPGSEEKKDDSTFINSETEVARLCDNFSEVDNDNNSAGSHPVIGRNGQFQANDDKISNGMYSDKVENRYNNIMDELCTVSDRAMFPSIEDKMSEVYKKNNGAQQRTDYCVERNVDTLHHNIRLRHDDIRLFVSLDDFRRGKGWTSNHHFSLRSLNSDKRVNRSRRFDNSALSNIRSIDIHLLASIRHLLEKTEHGENWPPLLSTDDDDDAQSEAENSSKKTSFISKCLSSPTLKANLDMLKDKRFLAFAVSNFLNNLAFMACIVHLVDRAVFHGIDKSIGAIIISASGLGTIFGRLFYGWLANHVCSNHLVMYIATLVLCGLGTVASPLCGQIAVLHGIFAVFFGSMMGVYVILAPLVTVYLMGVSKVATAYGLVLFFMGPATVVGGPFAGWLFDWTKAYVMSYVVNGIFLLASGVMLVPLLLGPKKSQSQPLRDGSFTGEENSEADTNRKL